VKTGRLRIVHRLVPSKDDPLAMLAARCALASARIGRFEDVTQALFQRQERWMNDGNLDAVLSQKLSLGRAQAGPRVGTGRGASPVARGQITAGRAAGVRLTPDHGHPTMPARRRRVVGAVSHGHPDALPPRQAAGEGLMVRRFVQVARVVLGLTFRLRGLHQAPRNPWSCSPSRSTPMACSPSGPSPSRAPCPGWKAFSGALADLACGSASSTSAER